MILNVPRACVKGCGATVEWAADGRGRVGLVESATGRPHVCPRRCVAAHVRCACGARVHRFADGRVVDAVTGRDHRCAAVPA